MIWFEFIHNYVHKNTIHRIQYCNIRYIRNSEDNTKKSKTYFHWGPQSDLTHDGGTKLYIKIILDKHIQIIPYSTKNCNLTKLKQVDYNQKVYHNWPDI